VIAASSLMCSCRRVSIGKSNLLNMSIPESKISRSKIRVRYAETDQMGVAYHANFFIWFEVGRVELMRELGLDYKHMEIEEQCHIAVVEASCRYKSPARYDDELILETHIVALRRSVLKFGYRVLRDETGFVRLLADGETTHVVVDRQMQKIALPERYATALGEFLILEGPR
jgi:acyl-CoA thioester hydrolase